jgi:hypothetical protein
MVPVADALVIAQRTKNGAKDSREDSRFGSAAVSIGALEAESAASA